MMIASRQCRSVPEAMAANPSSHLLLWEAFFEWEERNLPLYYYLAQIATDVTRANSNLDLQYRRQLTLGDKLMPKREPVVPAGIAVSPEMSKLIWLGWAGISPEKAKAP